MISTPRLSPDPSSAACAGGGLRRRISPNWHHIGAVAEVAVWDELNRVKDRQDEALDAMRVSNGMTLDEYLASK